MRYCIAPSPTNRRLIISVVVLVGGGLPENQGTGAFDGKRKASCDFLPFKKRFKTAQEHASEPKSRLDWAPDTGINCIDTTRSDAGPIANYTNELIRAQKSGKRFTEIDSAELLTTEGLHQKNSHFAAKSGEPKIKIDSATVLYLLSYPKCYPFRILGGWNDEIKAGLEMCKTTLMMSKEDRENIEKEVDITRCLEILRTIFLKNFAGKYKEKKNNHSLKLRFIKCEYRIITPESNPRDFIKVSVDKYLELIVLYTLQAGGGKNEGIKHFQERFGQLFGKDESQEGVEKLCDIKQPSIESKIHGFGTEEQILELINLPVEDRAVELMEYLGFRKKTLDFSAVVDEVSETQNTEIESAELLIAEKDAVNIDDKNTDGRIPCGEDAENTEINTAELLTTEGHEKNTDGENHRGEDAEKLPDASEIPDCLKTESRQLYRDDKPYEKMVGCNKGAWDHDLRFPEHKRVEACPEAHSQPDSGAADTEMDCSGTTRGNCKTASQSGYGFVSLDEEKIYLTAEKLRYFVLEKIFCYDLKQPIKHLVMVLNHMEKIAVPRIDSRQIYNDEKLGVPVLLLKVLQQSDVDTRRKSIDKFIEAEDRRLGSTVINLAELVYVLTAEGVAINNNEKNTDGQFPWTEAAEKLRSVAITEDDYKKLSAENLGLKGCRNEICKVISRALVSKKTSEVKSKVTSEVKSKVTADQIIKLLIQYEGRKFRAALKKICNNKPTKVIANSKYKSSLAFLLALLEVPVEVRARLAVKCADKIKPNKKL